MSNNNIDPIANNALKSLIDELPKAKEVKNLLQELIEAANKPAEPQYTAKEIDELESAPTVGIQYVYFANKHDREGVEWSVDFERTTSICFEWKTMPYMVIQGPYTPVCFNLNRAFYQGSNDVIGFSLKRDRVFIHMDPHHFPTEGEQQDLLNVAGKGNPTSGR